MKPSILLLLVTSLLFVNSLNASQEPPELQEAAKLTASVEKLFNEKKFDEALPPAKRALQLREKLSPGNSSRASGSE